MNEALDAGDLAPAAKRYPDFRAEPATLYAQTDPALVAVGVRLLGRKKFAPAVELLKLNAADNPDSPDVHALLGEAYFLGGEKRQAARHFARALALHPQNAFVADRPERFGQK